MDTDSFILDITTYDMDMFLTTNKDFFDLSNYSNDSSLYDPTNENVIGKFKYEISTRSISKFVSLSGKCYAFLLHPEENIKRAKGVQHCKVDHQLTF